MGKDTSTSEEMLWVCKEFEKRVIDMIEVSSGITMAGSVTSFTLATSYLEGSVNNARIQLMMDKHSYDITGVLHDLVEKGTLLVDGYGRGKVYYLNEEYNSNV